MKPGILLLNSAPLACLEFASRRRLSHVELALEMHLEDLTSQAVKTLAALARQANIAVGIHAPSCDLVLGSPNSGIRRESVDQIVRSVELFAGVAKYVTIHTGFVPQFRKAGSFEHTVDALRNISDRASTVGMQVLVENVFEKTIDSLLDYLRHTCRDNVAITFDPAHAHVYSAYLPQTGIEVIGSLIRNVHLSDNDGRSDLHLPLGVGNVPIEAALSALWRTHYDGPLTIEARNTTEAELSLKKLDMCIQGSWRISS